jgi:hypothetical protein
VTEIPASVVDWLRSVFADCNRRITEKLSMSPNIAEESLDMTWIEHLSHYSSPVSLDSDWVVKIESHFLGGRRHFYSWEIADIGLLVHLRLGQEVRKSKVGLLQSKRLYPVTGPVRIETQTDYEIGFARLADPEDEALGIGFDVEFHFSEKSVYEALHRDSDQARAIEQYQQRRGLRVYYQLYNPWTLPYSQRIPLVGYDAPSGSPDLGVRIVPSALLHQRLAQGDVGSPSIGHLAEIAPLPDFGWRLEQFVCDELLACHEGDEYTSIDDARIQRLFNRRSGPIAAAIAITIEAPAPAA